MATILSNKSPVMKSKIEERSSLWGFGATAALGGGIGYGLYRAHPAVRAVMASGQRDIAAEVSEELRTLGRFNVVQANTSAMTGDIGEDVLRSLVDSANGFGSSVQGGKYVRTDIAHAAYEAMLAGGKATHNEAYSAYQEILGQSSVRNAYQMAKQNVTKLQGDTSLLTSRISDLGVGGFYNESRLLNMTGVGMSEGQFAGSSIFQRAVGLGDLSDDIRIKAENIQFRLTAAAKGSGGEINWRGVYNIEDSFEGRKVITPMLRGQVGSEAINIPLANTGMTYGGEHLTARYLTRGSYSVAGDIKNYTDEYVSHLEKSMAVQETQTAMKHAVIDANRNIIENIHNRDSASRAMAIWKMPEPMLTSGGRVRSRLNLMEAVYSGREMTEELRDQIINESINGGRQLYPIGSPETVAKGTFIRSNIAEDLFGPMGRLMGLEQRPTQFIREQFGVTAGAKARTLPFRGSFGQFYSRLDRKIQGSEYKKLLYGGADIAAAEAYSAPQLTTFYAKPSNLESGPLSEIMFAEEVVLGNKAAPMMEYERVVQKKITLNKGFRTNQHILDALKGKKLGELASTPDITMGSFLGTEMGTGKELWMQGAGGSQAQVIGAQLTDQNTATVFMKERHNLSEDQWWKFFSEDVKFMGKASDETRMQNILAAAGAGPKAGLQDIEAVASGKLVQRNRMALMTQQTEALSMLTAAKIDKKELPLQMAEDFLSDPSKHLGINKLRNKNILDAEFQIQKNMVALSKKFGFTEKEMGLTFGLMNRGTLKKLAAEGDLTLREAAHIARAPGVIGLSKMRLGDFAFEGGAGGRASFEHTGFRMLSMKGKEGERFAAEMATRIKGKGELLAGDKMMASVVAARGLKGKAQELLGKIDVDERLLGQMRPEDVLQDTGRYVNLGQSIEAFGGAKQIYIPGRTEAETLMGYSITEKGQRIRSPIPSSVEELRGLLAKGAAQEEIEASALRLRNNIVQQTELQASAKGKVIGSRLLTGIRQTAKQTARSNGAIGISKSSGERMFDELIDRAKTQEQKLFLGEQKRRLLEEGHEVVGGMWRHPTTGAESFQFVHYKIDKELTDEMISVPRQMGEIVLNGKRKKVDISAMTGMKGDFDKDTFAIAAISDRDTYNRVSSKMNNEIQEGYTGYLFNHYAMKDAIDGRKGNIDSLLKTSYEEAMSQGAKNLTTAKTATGQVNVALQKLKLGMQYAAPEKYRPMSELFWHLEEAAIGGKHGIQNSKLYQDIAHSVNKKDVSGLENVIKQLIGDQDLEVSGAITGPTGKWSNRELSLSARDISEQAIGSVSLIEKEVDVAVKSASIAKGKSTSKELSELTEMFFRRQTGSIDVAQSVMHSQAYGMPGFTENTSRALRKASTKGKAIFGALRKAKGPALIGATIAAGIMLSAPSVSGTLERPQGSLAGGRNLSPDTLGPPEGLRMNPPPGRIMRSPQVYDMTGVQTSSRANIRLSMPDANRNSKDFMRRASRLAQGGNVRVKTTDDRSALSAHRLANQIHERL